MLQLCLVPAFLGLNRPHTGISAHIHYLRVVQKIIIVTTDFQPIGDWKWFIGLLLVENMVCIK
jgi:hypothetical protein